MKKVKLSPSKSTGNQAAPASKPRKSRTAPISGGFVVVIAVLLIAVYFWGDNANPNGNAFNQMVDVVLRVLTGEDGATPAERTAEPTRARTVRQPVPTATTAADAPLPDQPGSASTPAETSADWYTIYFTTPALDGSPCADATRAGANDIDTIIARDVEAAQQQIDIAAFELNAEPIVNALLAAKARKLTVRVVIDSDHAGEESIRRLRRGGISVVEDQRSAFMHNKFVVIDNHTLWTGAMNFTDNDVYCNNNNTVRFVAPQLAANYTLEMDEMYVGRSFGPTSPDNTPAEVLTISGVRVENYFSPEKEKELVNLLARTVARADSEILFMGFSFTNAAIGEAMLGRAEGGVTMRGVFETTGSSGEQSYYDDMRQIGLDNVQVRQDGNPRIMHHKVIIIDRQTTVFGSFNFSNNANNSNDENILIVYDPDFTKAFVQEFERVWAAANK